jgi:hypothetical protein
LIQPNTSIDSTSYKPLAVNSSGRVVKMNNWFGGSSLDTSNKFVNNIVKKNDSTFTFFKGNNATDITLTSSGGGGGGGGGTLQSVLDAGNIYIGNNSSISLNDNLNEIHTTLQTPDIGDHSILKFNWVGLPYGFWMGVGEYGNKGSLQISNWENEDSVNMYHNAISFANNIYSQTIIKGDGDTYDNLNHIYKLPYRNENIANDTLASIRDVRTYGRPYKSYVALIDCHYTGGSTLAINVLKVFENTLDYEPTFTAPDPTGDDYTKISGVWDDGTFLVKPNMLLYENNSESQISFKKVNGNTLRIDVYTNVGISLYAYKTYIEIRQY